MNQILINDFSIIQEIQKWGSIFHLQFIQKSCGFFVIPQKSTNLFHSSLKDHLQAIARTQQEQYHSSMNRTLTAETSIFGSLKLPDQNLPEEKIRELRDLAERASHYKSSSMSENTKRSYKSAWKSYSEWCESMRLDPLSGNSQQIGMYLTKKADTLLPSSLQVHLAAIVTAHRLFEIPVDPKSASIAYVMEGIKREKGTAPTRQAAPITFKILEKMVKAQPDSIIGLRDKAILLVGFGGAMRRSEIVSLNVGDIEFVPDKGILINLRKSKTDQEGQGSFIAIHYCPDQELCAATAIRKWLESRGRLEKDDPVFIGFTKSQNFNNRRLSDKTVSRLIQSTALAIGEADEELLRRNFGSINLGKNMSYSGHSLRAGLLTEAGQRDIPILNSMNQSRHKSVEAAKRYIRSAEVWRNNVTTIIFGGHKDGNDGN